MKYCIVIIGLVFSYSCFAQAEKIVSETLTKNEYEFLNSNLNTEKYTYDFTNKKVAFFSSPGGTVLRSKSEFFRTEDGITVGVEYFDIVIFNEKQKAKHGFDVAVVYDSKNNQPKVSNKLKRLMRKNN
ncbi:hypothetical protein [Flammeovirga sp. EKP202]|uniref:hypothetical protein n=1 Tax=Flammeovirga sp. EKP202 TaxID=2770592 RepID=UPI00165EF1BF|nr:hypothetical protein [Flammeovirga sp. EKP202]MBD0404085.1 hypothetical protein [Flammeovirga sp. EKP202]